ncbi:hypothetical protein [Comamonas koreensis]|uniref:Uncharacterized protein n=1 Tax=Comamonas koreensis TaxID=160825 RepID=A0AAW4XZ27_9BURK|nr:hypothetical protein [Comamonas koreensis]MCD2166899.1 hypothetical protein [Comamonas koreensis]
MPATPSSATTPHPRGLPPKVYLASAACADAAQLAQQLAHDLAQCNTASPPAFVLQACSFAQLTGLPAADGPAIFLARHDAVLLLAPPMRDSASQADPAQTLLMQARLHLAAQGQAFQLLFSQGHRREQDALAALCNWFPQAQCLQALRAALRQANPGARAGWNCEKCSDPDCELRLFQSLISP